MVDSDFTNMNESIAAPRKNGELQFDAPWQARAFGLAVALNEGGAYPWAEFSARLSDVIAAAEKTDDPSAYYNRWLKALEGLAIEKGLLTEEELASKAEAVAREDDHDHHHDGEGRHPPH